MANWTPEDGAKESVTNPSEAQISSEDPSVKPAALPAALPCLIPSFADAVRLLNSRYSCLVLETHRRHISLPPVYLRKKRSGIQEELNAELLKYSNSLKGVPVAYDNIKVVGQHGDIYDDQGYVHMNIEASFVIFKPKKGSKLVGVINKIGVGHVGCLVHSCFNACVVKPSLLTPEQWRDSGLQVGESLEFEVFQLDSDAAGVLLIRGRLEKSRVQQLVTQMEQTEGTTEAENEDSTDSPKPKKKKKKDKSEKQATVEDSLEDSSLSQTCGNHEPDLETLEVDSNSNGQHKKKKKRDKSEKQATVEDYLDNSSLSQTHGNHEPDLETLEVDSNSNGHHKKKKKKRDKSEKQATVEDSLEDSSLSQTCENHEADLEAVQVDSNSNRHHKKKKKDKRKESDETLPSDLLASDSSGYVSEKISKKRRAAEIDGDSETPVSKKKKKSQ